MKHNYKFLRHILLCLCLLTGINASAYDAEIDGIYYDFSEDEAMVTYQSVQMNSWSYSYISDYSGAVVIPESVAYGGKTYYVTSIGAYAFFCCRSLTSVTIPNSVTSIGDNAFSGCTSLTSVTIPNSVTSIGAYAFSSCTSLTSVTIPNSVTSIGDYTFYGCSGLTYVTIPEGVTSIGSQVFYGCIGLTSVTIPEGVTSIGSQAFYNCRSLTSITIPSSVVSVDGYAFLCCFFAEGSFINNSTLTSANNWGAAIIDEEPEDGLGLSGTTIVGCRPWVTSVIIPEGVTRIMDKAFSLCMIHNVLIKCTTPPSVIDFNNLGDYYGTGYNLGFSNQTYYHTTLYVPAGSWDAYAYDKKWYQFINIREAATSEKQLSDQQAYTLMDANTFTYTVYDPVNDCVGTINSVSGINEDNPNHSWQMMEAGGMRYLYNIGAGKYVKRNGNGFDLTDTPEPIEVADGDNGIILGAQDNQQWALVSNERMNVAQSAIDDVTGILQVLPQRESGEGAYNLAGQRTLAPERGINILRMSDGTTKKVLVK